MNLRDYQIASLAAIREARDVGISKQLVVLPCGSGKTVIFAHLPETLGLAPGEGMMVVVQRDELCRQASDKIQRINPHLRVEIEKAESQADPQSDVVIASVQTVGRAKQEKNGRFTYSSRLEKFNADRFKIVVCDEAHHCISTTHKNILRYLGVLKNDSGDDQSKSLIGVTATPTRGDQVGLEEVFQKIVYQQSLREMIGAGWLTDVQAFRVWTDHDLSEVHTKAGDFSTKELENAINTPRRNNLIVNKYIELGGGHQALAFTVDVQHTKDLCQAFIDHGIAAAPLTGMTPTIDRRRIIQDYASRAVRIICSANVISEGFDAPNATVGLMCRPTKSSLLFIQQLGRILRPSPAPEDRATHVGPVKENAILIDFADQSGRHKIVSLSSLFGLRADFDCKGKKVVKVIEKVEQLELQFPGSDIRSCKDIESIRSFTERVDLFAAPIRANLGRGVSRMDWAEMPDGSLRLSLPDKLSFRIFENALGFWEVFQQVEGTRFPEGVYDNRTDAIVAADQLIPRDVAVVAFAKAAWHRKPPTENQCQMLFWKDPRAKIQFRNWQQLFSYATSKHESRDITWSRKGMSDRIDAVTEARPRVQTG